eukprot:gnl/TRDRNA2_/TRDRNA2_55401_c0_seq1.p1 gnl/TRDRNA2_/TRDRNA2_55401_c0~~gnl/TRDRNA2_/TRDRNA2_55401_c0_seq1.p1  ORF type:complete len:349 (+),score=62.29 gnl/TRDRNA2_/TRDRNA2_55401_c0_seq1:64-1110(+)
MAVNCSLLSTVAQPKEVAQAMPAVDVVVRTLAGSLLKLSLPSGSCVGDAKLAAETDYGLPPEQQRWLVGSSVLDDADVLAAVVDRKDSGCLEVLCVFLPRSFKVLVKLIYFSPPELSEPGEDVHMSASPGLPVADFKHEIASCLSLRNASMQLLKNGIHMQDDRPMGAYHVDVDCCLYAVVPRKERWRASLAGCGGSATMGMNEDPITLLPGGADGAVAHAIAETTSPLAPTETLAEHTAVCKKQDIAQSDIVTADGFQMTAKTVYFTPSSPSEAGPELCFRISPGLTVGALKREAAACLGLRSVHCVRLLWDGLQMQDEKTIAAYHMRNGSTLHVVAPRPRRQQPVE